MAVEGKTILQTPERTELTGKEGIPFQEGVRNGHVLLERIREYSQTEVVDDLTSDDSEKALSAAQGKVLNDKIAEISNPASADKDGLMSKEDKKTFDSIRFSEDENSIWFNGNRYGAFHLKRVEMLSASSTSSEIASVIGEATEDNFISIVNFIAKGGLFIVQDKWREYVAISNYNNTGDKRYVQFEYIKLDNNTVYNRIKFDFNGSSWSFNVFRIKTDDIVNNLTSTDTTKPLSAAMGKELNDKIEAIKSEISALRDEIEALKGSGS